MRLSSAPVGTDLAPIGSVDEAPPSPDLALPVEAAPESVSIMSIKRAGKSYRA